MTLYVAALSAMPAIAATFAAVTEVRLYWFFVAFTPVLLLLVLAGKATWRRIQRLPILEGLAVVEAGSVDGGISHLGARDTRHPVPPGRAGQVVAAFGALSSSPSDLLTLLEPIFEPSRSGKLSDSPEASSSRTGLPGGVMAIVSSGATRRFLK